MTEFIKKNPLVVHVAAEVIVLGGISFYFQKRILKLESSLKNVIENVEKMHNVLFQHEKNINNLINGLQQNNIEHQVPIEVEKNSPEKKPKKKIKKKQQPVLKKLNKVVNKSESEGEESFSDDDLDEELSNELNELKENNLKRENKNNNNDDDE